MNTQHLRIRLQYIIILIIATTAVRVHSDDNIDENIDERAG